MKIEGERKWKRERERLSNRKIYCEERKVNIMKRVGYEAA